MNDFTSIFILLCSLTCLVIPFFIVRKMTLSIFFFWSVSLFLFFPMLTASINGLFSVSCDKDISILYENVKASNFIDDDILLQKALSNDKLSFYELSCIKGSTAFYTQKKEISDFLNSDTSDKESRAIGQLFFKEKPSSICFNSTYGDLIPFRRTSQKIYESFKESQILYRRKIKYLEKKKQEKKICETIKKDLSITLKGTAHDK